MDVHFFSDGPSSQFKNRFMIEYARICQLKYELKSLSWHFFATSHGKGVIDGVGGTLKRMAWTRVKARQLEVRNAEEFFDAVKNSKVACCLIPDDKIQSDYAELEPLIINATKVSFTKQH